MIRNIALLSVGLLVLTACNNEENVSSADGPALAEVPFAAGHFSAVLPCNDCERHHLNVMLWSTGSAFVRDEKLASSNGEQLERSWGRWTRSGSVISIANAGTEIYSFTIKDQSTIVWNGESASAQPNAYDLSRAEGTLVPRGEVDMIGTYYTPSNPKVVHVRECASGKNFIVRLDPAAADIQSRFEELNINRVEGVTASFRGTLQAVNVVDEETGGDKVLLTIKSWSGFLPEQKCER